MRARVLLSFAERDLRRGISLFREVFGFLNFLNLASSPRALSFGGKLIRRKKKQKFQ